MSIFKKLISVLTIGYICIPLFIYAETPINLYGPNLIPKSELFITPRNANFLVGSTFETPIYIDTYKNNINAVNLKIKFDPKKLSIVKPSGGKSIFGIWVETPSYDNTRGTASLVGLIPGGIVTSSGLIGTITFKALESGTTKVSITDYSSANLNDGFGSEVKLTLNGATYNLTPKPPEGAVVSSQTHPSQERWYNNNSPVISWESEENTLGFSIVLDSNPQTIPANIINTQTTSAYYENLKDGIWYFHVKSNKENIWGNTSHFQIKIDTTPPASFTPDANTISENNTKSKYLLSFLTTDSLSGINHYEIGTIDKKTESSISPVFIETESPYLIPLDQTNNLKAIVRVFDNAGNMREESIDLYPSFSLIAKIKQNTVYILLFLLLIIILEILAHYIFGHKIFSHIRRAYEFFKRDSKIDTNTDTQIPPSVINTKIENK